MGARDLTELVRRCAVTSDEVVELLGCGVAAGTGVGEQDTRLCAAEGECGGEPGRAPSHDDDVVLHWVLLPLS